MSLCTMTRGRPGHGTRLLLLAALSLFTALGAAGQAAASDEPIPEPTIDEIRFEGGRYLFAEIQDQRCVIALQGRIGPDATRQFTAVLQRARDKGCDSPLVVLQSGGGAVEDGLSLGREIHLAGYSTMVAQSCASACGLIFMGGRERILMGPTARIGLHQASRIENRDTRNQRRVCTTDRQAVVYRRISRYLEWVLGAERAEPVFERSLATPCRSMDWVRGAEAIAMGVATEVRE